MPSLLAVLLLVHADYAAQVKPLLAARCYACHGALKQKAGLRLDTVAAMKTGGDNGPALVPGKSGESLLVLHVAGKKRRMPPSADGEPLKKAEVALLAAWIDAGAIGPADERPEADPNEHWAFRSPVRPRVPTGHGSNPIDAFLGAERARRKLAARPEADRRVLLRRVTLGLTGLPPTASEMELFLADHRPDAYERAVRRLLASPRYGERWGRHWMDVWRYSDWWGLGAEMRNSQKHIWHWRDWIMESLNADAGYDSMVRDMLAADELAPTDESRVRATGFLARSYFKFSRNTWLEEVTEHTGKAFLGLTINCAKCHDHKYDPIAQEDFYRFRAFFEPYQIRLDMASSTDFEKDGVPRVFDCDLDRPTYLFIRDEKNPRKKPLAPGLPTVFAAKLDIRAVNLPLEAYTPGMRPAVLAVHLKQAEERIRTARAALAQAKAALVVKAKVPVAGEAPPPLVTDDFRAAKPSLWEEKSGKWKYEGGTLRQEQVGSTRAVLRLKKAMPLNFEARLGFTPTGGKMWRSVGLSFDVAGDNEVLVYLSANAAAPKLQIAYKKKGDTYVYPPTASRTHAVKVGERQELVVRVRDALVNVEVNGRHALAYRLPLARKAGGLELVTFDAKAEFAAFRLAPLPATAALQSPGAASPGTLTPAQAKHVVAVAEKGLAAALLHQAAVRAAHAGHAKEAAQAEHESKISEAEAAVARAGENKKKLAAARAALASLRKTPATFTPLRGALKTLASNTESEASRNKPFPKTSSGRRSALAQWITARSNPLTARVAVNHIWTRHFGTPLVSTMFDFGRKGARPTHPELLDWLAVELMESGWSMKHLHELIVTSNAYRMSSASAGADAQRRIDPENKAYWRMNSVRMEAEAIRDALLYLAGDLDQQMGGPPTRANAETTRRSLYFFHSHNEQNKFLSIFDDANVLECYRRSESVLPQQALALQNSKLALEAAQRIAARITARDDVGFARSAFETVLCQKPSAEELAECVAALKSMTRNQLVHALLNHNDFVTIR